MKRIILEGGPQVLATLSKMFASRNGPAAFVCLESGIGSILDLGYGSIFDSAIQLTLFKIKKAEIGIRPVRIFASAVGDLPSSRSNVLQLVHGIVIVQVKYTLICELVFCSIGERTSTIHGGISIEADFTTVEIKGFLCDDVADTPLLQVE